ncbi:MAG TPA: MerR family transcriptional regulator [Gemmatimonadaceae bacterium]|jgi:DNA-binding transcriptional MerR regulator|nr:MerR family transcriptional regulator [Gemmatimonadaceae bacterium]
MSPQSPRPAHHAAHGQTRDPVQEFFSIGEVCELTGLKPHVLRYWESQFRFLSPAKNRSGNRVYQRREIELIMLVKHLLYTEKYTIDGARQKVDQHRRKGELRPAARTALDLQTIETMEQELREVLSLLGGDGVEPAQPAPKSSGGPGGGGRHR